MIDAALEPIATAPTVSTGGRPGLTPVHCFRIVRKLSGDQSRPDAGRTVLTGLAESLVTRRGPPGTEAVRSGCDRCMFASQ